MGRTYKWLGGIGYILTLIPYANLAALILTAIAWIMMGRDTKQTLFTVTGILMIITFAMNIAALGAIFTAIPEIIPGVTRHPTEIPPPEFLKKPLAFAKIFVPIGVAAAAVGLASLIAEIASHFRASRIFQNTWFKVGGWLRIATIIVAVIAIPIIIFMAMSRAETLKGVPPNMMTKNIFTFMLFTGILWPILIALILGLLATVFSIVAFFTIPEEAEV